MIEREFRLNPTQQIMEIDKFMHMTKDEKFDHLEELRKSIPGLEAACNARIIPKPLDCPFAEAECQEEAKFAKEKANKILKDTQDDINKLEDDLGLS